MRLIVIVIGLALERYVGFGDKLKRFNWFSCYVAWLKKVIKVDALWQAWIGLALLIAPVLLSVMLLYWIMCVFAHGVFALVLSTAIFYYCLGPKDLYVQLNEFFTAAAGQDKTQQDNALKSLLGDKLPEDAAKQSRAVTEMIFDQSYVRLFAIVFWYVVLGPLGALLYRLVSLINQISDQKDSDIANLSDGANTTQQALDWIPTRILSLSYALVGNFMSTFGHWLKNIVTGLAKSRMVFAECSLFAMGIKSSTKADLAENKEAFAMTDRALIVVLVLIAAFIIGSWL